jgi:hypothetical protein
MARLPHSDLASLELRKLEDYCLDPTHPRGRHKARVFRQALGLERSDAQWLRELWLASARDVGASHSRPTLSGRAGAPTWPSRDMAGLL